MDTNMETAGSKRTIILAAATLLLAGTLFATCGSFFQDGMLTKWYAFSAGGTLLALAACIAGRFKSLKFNSFTIAFLVFIGYLVARQVIDGCAYLRPALTAAAAILFLTFSSLDEDGRRAIKSITVILCAANALLMLLQYARIVPTTAGFRVTGMMDNPAGAALCTAIGLPFCISKAMEAKRGPRYAYGAAFLLMSAAIILSDSRCGMLCVMASIFWAVLVRCPADLRKKLLRAGAAVCLLGFVILCFYKKDSTSGRMFIWKNCISLAAEKPILGHGAGSFGRTYMPEQADFFARHPDSGYESVAGNTKKAFNEILQLQVEYGLAGTLLLLVALTILIRRADWKKDESAAAAAFAIFAMFSYPSYFPFATTMLLFCISDIGAEGRTVGNSKAVAAAICALTLLCAAYTVKDAAFETRMHRVCLSESEGKDVQMKELYRHWNGNPEFMNQFVREFTRRKDYDAVNIAFQRLKEKRYDYQIVLMEAENFLRQGMVAEAASCYAEAHHMIPAKFEPLYHLMMLFEGIGRHGDASTVADEILRKPVKVPSAKVDAIRSEAAKIKENGRSEF